MDPVLAFSIIFKEQYVGHNRPSPSSGFLVAGDPSSRSQVKPSHSWDPVSAEPAIRSGQADRQPGGKQALVTPPFCSLCLALPLVSHASHFSAQRQCEQARLRENEEKLIVSAWYNKVLLALLLLFKIPPQRRNWPAPSVMSSERELPEAGDGVSPQRPQRLLLHVPDALLLVAAASSVQRATPGTLHQRACHYLQVDFWRNSRQAGEERGNRDPSLGPTSQHLSDLKAKSAVVAQVGVTVETLLYRLPAWALSTIWHDRLAELLEAPPPCFYLIG